MNVFTHTLSGQQKKDKTDWVDTSEGLGFRVARNFTPGDLVSWTALGSNIKNYAIVLKIRVRGIYNSRTFYTAEVQTTKGETKEINIGILKLESKADRKE
jgi:hypothetical protein